MADLVSTADILIIGGGIAGASAGAELARDARVLVLEAEAQPGYHATGRSAAIFIHNYGNATLRALNALSFDALNGALLEEPVLSPRGELLLARANEMEPFEDYLAGTRGIETLTAKEATALVPVLRRDQFAAAAFEPEAMDIDVDRLLQGCLRLLRNRGGDIQTGQRVTAMERKGGHWQVTAGETRYEAPVVVNAAGAWADEIAALAGMSRIGLRPLRRSALIMGLPPEITDHRDWPLFGSVSETWYAKPDPGGLMISPADEDPVAPQDAWPDDMVLAEGLERFSQMVDLPLRRPSHSWAGLRSFVQDRTPVVGFDPEADGFCWLAAQGGYGVQTAPALARLTRALCMGQSDGYDPALLSAVSPARFRQ